MNGTNRAESLRALSALRSSYPPCARLDAIRVVLSRPSHPGNIGAAARAMKTMGLSRLSLVAPERFPHPDAVARSAGAEDLLDAAEIFPTTLDALGETVFAFAVTARPRRLGPESVSARDAALEALAVAERGDVAFFFGNETSGLSNEDLMRCQRVVYIPANPEYSSLNLGAAVQVLCYELRCAVLGASRSPALGAFSASASPAAHISDVERFYEHLESVMTETGFLDPAQPRRLLPKLRRLFGRARLERDEVNILRGILDAVEKRIRHP
ncbi:MAG: RNA methyltransferase [Candidatus Accumulibacter sp.]|jgi:tRNA/rRNA methyltransferase|nr:RNA methyltransferase [Accumulibacter sp.]